MSKLKKIEGGVLAEGETSNHYHRANTAVMEREDGVRVFTATPKTMVTHEEHGPVTAPPSWLEQDNSRGAASGRVREYDHFLEEARQVKD